MGVIDDLRHGVRALVRAPAFFALTLVTLALGIGTTSAMFSVVYGVVFRPLPVRTPEAVVQVWRTTSDQREGNFAAGPYFDLQREARSFSGVAAVLDTAIGLGAHGGATRVNGAVVTPNFFDVLGASAQRGRVFAPALDAPGSDTLVLSDALWRRDFGGADDIIGRTIVVDGRPATVVGVMAPEFDVPAGSRVWRVAERAVPHSPLPIDGDPLADRGVGYLDVVARLRDGVSVREADAELRVLAGTLAERFPTSDQGDGFVVRPLHDALVGEARPSLLVLFGAVAVVLLIACTNLASVLLARALGRQREFAVRVALGAGRGRLARQLLVESLLVALTGGIAGIVAGSWLLDGLRALLPASVPRTAAVQLDGTSVAFALVVATVVGLGFGAAPAWWTSQLDAHGALRDGDRAVSGRRLGRQIVVAAQSALAVILLAAAGVMAKSLLSLQRQDIGFTPAGVMTQQIVLPQSRYDSAAQTRFFQHVVDRLRADPRVAAATVVFPTPLVSNHANATILLDRPVPGEPTRREYRVRLGSIASEYFATMGMRFVAGRDFAPTDFADTGTAAIVSASFATRVLGGGDVLDRHIRFDADDAPYLVVGVVTDAAAGTLGEDAGPVMYLPYSHLTLPFMRVMARGRGTDAATRDALVAAVRQEAPDLALDAAEPLSDVVHAAAADPRFRARLSAAFALSALTLAALGVYGLVSFSVTSRTREIATRLALGASPSAMRVRVLLDGLRLTTIGAAIGLVVVVALGRVVNGLLYRTTTADPLVLGSLVVLMFAVTLAACYLPARRAMRVDPMIALRAE